MPRDISRRLEASKTEHNRHPFHEQDGLLYCFANGLKVTAVLIYGVSIGDKLHGHLGN